MEAKPLCGPSSDEKWTSSIYNHLLRANGTTPVAGKCIAGESDRPWVLATVNKKIEKPREHVSHDGDYLGTRFNAVITKGLLEK